MPAKPGERFTGRRQTSGPNGARTTDTYRDRRGNERTETTTQTSGTKKSRK